MHNSFTAANSIKFGGTTATALDLLSEGCAFDTQQFTFMQLFTLGAWYTNFVHLVTLH